MKANGATGNIKAASAELDLLCHPEPRAETGLDLAFHRKTAIFVKPPGARVGDHAKCKTAPPRLLRCSIDQRATDPSSPKIRFDEQAVQFGAYDRSKSDDLATEFSDNHLPIRNLAFRQVNGVGVTEQLIPIFGKLERSAPLQLLELVMLFRTPKPQSQTVSVI
jgi:hypothetical protein